MGTSKVRVTSVELGDEVGERGVRVTVKFRVPSPSGTLEGSATVVVTAKEEAGRYETGPAVYSDYTAAAWAVAWYGAETARTRKALLVTDRALRLAAYDFIRRLEVEAADARMKRWM